MKVLVAEKAKQIVIEYIKMFHNESSDSDSLSPVTAWKKIKKIKFKKSFT